MSYRNPNEDQPPITGQICEKIVELNNLLQSCNYATRFVYSNCLFDLTEYPDDKYMFCINTIQDEVGILKSKAVRKHLSKLNVNHQQIRKARLGTYTIFRSFDWISAFILESTKSKNQIKKGDGNKMTGLKLPESFPVSILPEGSDEYCTINNVNEYYAFFAPWLSKEFYDDFGVAEASKKHFAELFEHLKVEKI